MEAARLNSLTHLRVKLYFIGNRFRPIPREGSSMVNEYRINDSRVSFA